MEGLEAGEEPVPEMTVPAQPPVSSVQPTDASLSNLYIIQKTGQISWICKQEVKLIHLLLMVKQAIISRPHDLIGLGWKGTC